MTHELTGKNGGLLWVSPAIELIDFSENVLIRECADIGYLTKGMFSYDQIRNMDFDVYETLIKSCESLAESLKKEPDNG